MICEAKEAHEAAISERELCRLFGVSRSWYYERPSPEEKAARDIELRDAIERIVLEFPGYGYRLMSPRSSTGVDGRSTTSGCSG